MEEPSCVAMFTPSLATPVKDLYEHAFWASKLSHTHSYVRFYDHFQALRVESVLQVKPGSSLTNQGLGFF